MCKSITCGYCVLISFFIVLVICLPISFYCLIWFLWSKQLFALIQKRKDGHKWAMALGIAYWTVAVIIWVIYGFLCVQLFRKIKFAKETDEEEGYEYDEIDIDEIMRSQKALTNVKAEQVPGPSSSSKLMKAVNDEMNERMRLMSASRNYNSMVDNSFGSDQLASESEVGHSSETQVSNLSEKNVRKRSNLSTSRSSAKIKHESFIIGGELFTRNLDVCDVPKFKSDSDIPLSLKNEGCLVESSLLKRRMTRDDSFIGLPEFKPFEDYLTLVQVDSPMSPREVFFSDLYKMADEKEKRKALSKKAIEFIKEEKKMSIVASLTTLPTLHESRHESNEKIDKIAKPTFNEAGRLSRSPSPTNVTSDSFLPVANPSVQ
ncbi:hypothetical protein LSTR_LSTR016269 [Laodelphax striatellus]|uniref:Uncharacterized protein n=1 Tax=Laodelphax striatellus TaxID=195883 RepID=A0A482XPL8_LAOST|nr:hypothetical protein LSTR_LSTR016269 [Laodelphax striatellus]